MFGARARLNGARIRSEHAESGRRSAGIWCPICTDIRLIIHRLMYMTTYLKTEDPLVTCFHVCVMHLCTDHSNMCSLLL